MFRDICKCWRFLAPNLTPAHWKYSKENLYWNIKKMKTKLKILFHFANFHFDPVILPH